MLNERDLDHPLAGGVEVHLEELASRLARRHGIETTVLCSGYEGANPDEVRNGIRYVRFGRRFSYYAKLPGRARAHWRSGDYSVVVENLCKLLFFSQFYLPGAPHLGLVHHLFGLSAFRQVSVPIASYVALSEAIMPLAYRQWPFVAVSPSTRSDLRARLLPGERIRVIPNGLDHSRYTPDPTVTVDPNLVLFVGRLEHYKGVDWLLDAWKFVSAEHPGARLVLLGAGSAEGELRSRVIAASLNESIRFEGFVPESEKIDWLRRAQVVVQPSHKEGWGLTVLEANACGTPVVASRVPGLQDSVRHDETGLLVPAGKPEVLAKSVCRILDEPALRLRLSAAALEWAGRFSWEDVADAFAKILIAVAERRAIPEVPDWLGAGDLVGSKRRREPVGGRGEG